METHRDILALVNDWLKFAEAKNAVLVGTSAVGFWSVARLLNGELSEDLLRLYLIQLGFFLACAFCIALASFLPVLKFSFLLQKGDPVASDNLLYFGDLSKYRQKTLLDAIASATKQDTTEVTDLERMYVDQIIVNSRIAVAKYRAFTWAVYATFFGFLTPIVGGIALWIINHNRDVEING